MRLCLAMIVRDEVHVIDRCLAAARPLVDRWVIIDTGSTDGTQDKVREAMRGVHGRLVERPWVNFGHNRTELVALAREGARAREYLLCLDADMVVAGELDQVPDADGLELAYAGDLGYRQPLLLRASKPWRYVGATHEYLDCDEPFTTAPFDGLVIEHGMDGSRRPRKFDDDRELLERAAARDLFYLANTHRDLGNVDRARRLYLERAEMSGWIEETFCSLYEAGRLTEGPEGDGLLLHAWGASPRRAEPLWQLAVRARERGDHEAAYLFCKRGLALDEPVDVLFSDRSVYEWRLLYELSISAWWVGAMDEGATACAQLLAMDLPDEFAEAIANNRELYPAMQEA